jgi:hypothetical protein
MILAVAVSALRHQVQFIQSARDKEHLGCGLGGSIGLRGLGMWVGGVHRGMRAGTSTYTHRGD